MNDFSKAREHMVESQIRVADVTELNLLRAFRRTPRERFVPKAQTSVAYSDRNIELDEGRVMMRPRDLGKLIQACDIESTDVVLDIACSRGYSTAILAQLAETVVGLETTDEQVDRATNLLIDIDVTNTAVLNGTLLAGAAEHGPFDIIFVNGAVAKPPKAWFDQLADGGRLACIIQSGPVGRGTIFTKSGDAIGERVVFDSSAPYLQGFEPVREFTL